MPTTQPILLVEDNPGDALLLKAALRDFNHTPPFELIHVDRLAAAIERTKQERFDAVLLDLSLPDAKGVETVVRMQREAETLPIIVLTGLDDDAAAVEAVRAGAQDYLVKGQIDGRLLVRALSYAIERKRLQEAMRFHLERITALKDVNVALTANLNLASVLEVLCEKVGRLLPDFGMAVRLWNREQGLLESAATVNFDDSWWQSTVLRPDRKATLSETVFASKQPLVISDVANESRIHYPEFWRRTGVSGYLGIPLIANDETLGVISFFPKQGTLFTSQEIEFLSALASQASVAIRNSQIHGEMKRLADDLERSNHVKEEFLGVISHELRTPLNVVRGYVEILQTGMFGEMNLEQLEAIEKIANQTRIQLAMINSILNATTMESEVASVQTEMFSLSDFLDDFRVAFPDPADGHLNFDWCYSPKLPEIRSDRTKLQYILQNLINNAVKYTPHGMVAVSAEVRMGAPSMPDLEDSNSRKCWLSLSVSDTGVGIGEEFLPVIFEKFSQVDSSTTRAHEGIGLGLHIVKRCTELLSGTVKVESELGKGTTFFVTIPCEIDADGTRRGNVAGAAVVRDIRQGDEI
jgi:two-component system OmpR family sensor kinase